MVYLDGKLKSCVCGTNAPTKQFCDVYDYSEEYIGGRWRYVCPVCGRESGFFETIDEAEHFWNVRITDELEALKAR